MSLHTLHSVKPARIIAATVAVAPIIAVLMTSVVDRAPFSVRPRFIDSRTISSF